jgi:hypothetical protein
MAEPDSFAANERDDLDTFKAKLDSRGRSNQKWSRIHNVGFHFILMCRYLGARDRGRLSRGSEGHLDCRSGGRGGLSLPRLLSK